jgi:hypothetical protein
MQRHYWLGAILTLATFVLPAHAQVQMEWKLKEGDKFFLETISSLKQQMRTQGKEMKQDLEVATVFSLTVEKKNADNTAVLEQKIEGLMVKNAAGQAAGTDEKFNQQLVGAAFKVTLSPRGEVAKFEGYDDLLKKVAGDDANARKTVQSIVSEEVFKVSVAEAFGFLPDKPVKTGDSWERETTRPLGPLGSIVSKRKYSYDGSEMVEGKPLEKITFTATSTYTAPKPGEPNAFQFQVAKAALNLEDVKGTFLFDAAAGRLVRSEMGLKLKGTVVIVVMGTNLETEAQQDQTTRMRVLDKNPVTK